MSVDFNPAKYNDSFIADLVQFVAADEFQSMFENFFVTYALEFSDDDEHKLRYTEIYQDFHSLFEEQLETFCHNKRVTHAEFMKRCKEATSEDEKSKHYIDILLSSCEYDTFVRLMKIMRPVAMHRLGLKADSKSETASAVSPAKGGYSASASSPSKEASSMSAKESPSSASGSKSSGDYDYESDVKVSTSVDEYADYKGGVSSYGDEK